jgi:hypothetical protein
VARIPGETALAFRIRNGRNSIRHPRFEDQDPIEEASMYIGIGGLILLVIILIILF